MGLFFGGLLAVVWLLFIPWCVGLFYFRRENKSWSEQLLGGYILLFAITELISLSAIFMKLPLHMLTAVYGLISVFLAVCGLYILYQKRKAGETFIQRI